MFGPLRPHYRPDISSTPKIYLMFAILQKYGNSLKIQKFLEKNEIQNKIGSRK